MSKREMYLDQLEEERAQLLARAEQAERERDEARAQRDSAYATIDSMEADRLNAMRERDEAKRDNERLETWKNSVIDEVVTERDSLRARLAKTERVVEDFAEYDCEYGDNCPAFGSRHGRCVGCKARAALRDLDAPDDSPVGVAATAEDYAPSDPASAMGQAPARSATSGESRDCVQDAGAGHALDPQAPATRAELEELRREVLTTIADALCEVHVPMPGHEGLATVPHGLRELSDELRRRVERLEQLTGFVPKE